MWIPPSPEALISHSSAEDASCCSLSLTSRVKSKRWQLIPKDGTALFLPLEIILWMRRKNRGQPSVSHWGEKELVLLFPWFSQRFLPSARWEEDCKPFLRVGSKGSLSPPRPVLGLCHQEQLGWDGWNWAWWRQQSELGKNKCWWQRELGYSRVDWDGEMKDGVGGALESARDLRMCVHLEVVTTSWMTWLEDPASTGVFLK